VEFLRRWMGTQPKVSPTPSSDGAPAPGPKAVLTTTVKRDTPLQVPHRTGAHAIRWAGERDPGDRERSDGAEAEAFEHEREPEEHEHHGCTDGNRPFREARAEEAADEDRERVGGHHADG
jgi:hypothetical protein